MIDDLLSEPLPAGSRVLVEYDASSQWYAASVTIASGWLKAGGKVGYSAAAQPPNKIRSQLEKLGMNVKDLEDSGSLEIWDWYSATLGQKSKEKLAAESLKVSDLSIWFSKRRATREYGPEWLGIRDDWSSLDRFNDEKSWVEWILTRSIPRSSTWKSTSVGGIVRGLHSDSVYKRLEMAVDGIIDVKLEESGQEPVNLIRVRIMRNVVFDGRWHRLKVGGNFEVTVDK